MAAKKSTQKKGVSRTLSPYTVQVWSRFTPEQVLEIMQAAQENQHSTAAEIRIRCFPRKDS